MKKIEQFGTKVVASITDYFSVKTLAQTQGSIQNWFSSPLGQNLLAAEQETLGKIMPKIYGHHLMQLSVLNHINLSDLSPVRHHFSLGINEKSGQPGVANFEQLPIETESVDAVLLHHVLEYSTNPHQLLHEAARTTVPYGYLVIVGFNPGSPFALKKQWGRLFSREAHWRYHGLWHSRISDWLRVLDFEPVFLQFGFHGLPFEKVRHKTVNHVFGQLLPFTGAYYVIAARKNIASMKIIHQTGNKSTTMPVWIKGSAIPTQTTIHRQNPWVNIP